MPIMYCNIAKGPAFPLVSRVSRQSRCSNPSKIFCFHSFSSGVDQKNLGNICAVKPKKFSYEVHQKVLGNSHRAKSRDFSNGVCGSVSQTSHAVKTRSFSNGFHPKALGNISATRRSFSTGSYQRPAENDSGVGARKGLPWLAACKNRESNKLEDLRTEKRSSSGEDSAKSYFSRNGSKPSHGGKKSILRTVDDVENGRSGYARMYKDEEASTFRASQSSWDDSANIYFSKSGMKHLSEKRENKIKTSDDLECDEISGRVEDEQEEHNADEPVDDPRWDRIRNKCHKIIEREVRSEKPEVVRWNKQENWGRKTWKEASASTVPKIVGEGVYGIGPVLAALTIARREFYTLYVQEGLDLTGNSRKKKGKKGIEKVLRMAEMIGLTVKETSKHNLNMVVDNRPHQGLVLDASPLEMVSIKELDPISQDADKAPVWVALDEVTDPQNLGAIVRSAYFFGASGVVLCAKNSAPLSGVVSKASAGSLELIELRSCKNMMQFLSNSVENGWRVLGGSVSSKAIPLNDISVHTPTILVLGSEGSGLRPLVEKSCTQLIRIPGNIPVDVSTRNAVVEDAEDTNLRYFGDEFRSFMAVESLNVSVAAGVLLYRLVGIRNSNGLVGAKQTDAIE